MNHRLIKQLAEVKGEATIYFTNRTFPMDERDNVVFQILSDYLYQYGGKKKVDLYYELLRCWYFTLYRLKEEQYTIAQEEEQEAHDLFFYETFQRRTSSLSTNEKIDVLYRYPWYLRCLLVASTGKYFNEDFVHNVASMHKLEVLDFGEFSYLAITPYDHWAITTIQDDLMLGHGDQLTHQLTKNLPLIPFTLQHFETFLKKGADNVEEQDKHGLNILTFLLDIYQEEKLSMSAFQFVLFSLSAMCFWHFEASTMSGTWSIEQGKLQHLKRLREKLRKNK